MTDEPGWAGETRHLDANVLGELVGGLDGKVFLVAGPPQMAEAVADSLTGAGVCPRSASSRTSSPATKC